LLYSWIYIFSAWHHYLDHISTSFSRLIMQIVPVAWLLIAAAVAPRRSSSEIAETSVGTRISWRTRNFGSNSWLA